MVTQSKKLQPIEYLDKILTRWHLLKWWAIGFIAITAFIVGSCGLAVLMDIEDRKYWYSETPFAEKWRVWSFNNPLLTSGLFNGGLLVFVMSMKNISDHYNGLKVLRELEAKKKSK